MTRPDRAHRRDDQPVPAPFDPRLAGPARGLALEPGEPIEGGRLSRWAVDGLPGDLRELRVL